MRTASLVPHLLSLALLVQAAAAYGAMPCAGSGHADGQAAAHQTTARMDDAHAAHTGHQSTAGAKHHADMPCCDDDGVSACITSGHCLTASPLLPVPSLAVIPLGTQSSIAHDPDWLPPYGAPSGPLLRPPIA